MNDIKSYVIENFKDYENEINYSLYKKFLRVVGRLKVGIYQEKFNNCLKTFTYEDNYVNYIMVFIVLSSININILALDETLIEDIVYALDDIPFTSYERLLPYLLSYENIHGLEYIHKISQNKMVQPYHFLQSIISDIDYNHNKEQILKDISAYYESVGQSIQEEKEYIPWFSNEDNFDAIYIKVLKNMEELNDLAVQFSGVSIFSANDFKTLELLKKIYRLPFEKQEELLKSIKDYDLNPQSLQNKCEDVLKKVKTYYELCTDCDNIVYINF